MNALEFKSVWEERGLDVAITRLETSLLSLGRKATREELESFNLYIGILEARAEGKIARSNPNLREKLDR